MGQKVGGPGPPLPPQVLRACVDHIQTNPQEGGRSENILKNFKK